MNRGPLAEHFRQLSRLPGDSASLRVRRTPTVPIKSPYIRSMQGRISDETF